ncbi:MAG: thioredoxin domain-containing protein, partial [Oscillatoriales cyanobacterium SM2_1_8]|nr:thioredoxin domain-containing protein [Oscillatoriales cyanobacterium SM2_1_8]
MNQLAHCQSLYLRKHAHNPIHWQPWGDEALGGARRQNRPIFVSIGYSSCHWCTVMEGEAFSDPTVADYLNAHFVAIKVDREERPDLDSLYMQAVQVMGEQGGWPLNLFLTPDDLVPFYGGTYFPLEPRYGRPGFLRVLQGIVQIYRDRQGELQTYRQQILAQLRALTELKPTGRLGPTALRRGLQEAGRLVAH